MCVCALVGSVGVFLAQGRARVRFKKQSDAIPSQKRDQESSSGQFDRVKEAAFQTSTSPRSPPSTSTPARAAKIDHPWPARFCAGPFPLVPRRLRPPRPCGAFADATSAAGGGGVLRKPAGRGGLERGTASQTQRRALAIRRRRQPANHRHWQLGCLVSRGRRCVFPSAPPEIASTLNAHNARFFAPFDSNTKQKKRTPKTPMPSSTSSAPPQPFILLLWHSLFCKRRRQAESPPPAGAAAAAGYATGNAPVQPTSSGSARRWGWRRRRRRTTPQTHHKAPASERFPQHRVYSVYVCACASLLPTPAAACTTSQLCGRPARGAAAGSRRKAWAYARAAAGVRAAAAALSASTNKKSAHLPPQARAPCPTHLFFARRRNKRLLALSPPARALPARP